MSDDLSKALNYFEKTLDLGVPNKPEYASIIVKAARDHLEYLRWVRACKDEGTWMDERRNDYEEGYSQGHAAAWEQAIMAKEVDIKTIKIDPQDFGNTGFMSAHTQGWNDCLNHIAACNYRIVK